MILGLDIGGANTKAASSDGCFAQSVYLPLWRNAPLGTVLGRFANLSPTAVAVVMTGELADCYASKREGIECIMTAVNQAFRCPVYFWGSSGFQWTDPLELAAANWSASAALLSREIGDCLFVDMGSTTTDLIPIKGSPLAAKTDYPRLARGELVYMGLLRTSLGALLPSARIRGDVVQLSPELFAIIADAYLALGEISPECYACDTPDGSGKDRAAALRRLARAVCADLEEIGEAGAMAVAEQARDRQFRVAADAIEKQAERHGLSRMVAAGIGEQVVARAGRFLGMEITLLSEKYGPRISDLFPAYAAARLLEAGSILK
jgi:(4-(4-[2-(gamma-L-glutamylamino)ethyl]phenoxymethyl)furan-2-yl)methanamine synthase